MVGSAFPTICPAGTFCRAGLTLPDLCPLGTFSNPNVTMNRTDLDLSCSPCEPGTYGNDVFRLICKTCYAGFVCYGNTTRGDPRNLTMDRGIICPPGHWCSNGTASPNPCLRGTFNELPGQKSADTCLPCPRNSFNNFTGQAVCQPCGSSAVSNNDFYACTCKGNNRVFHPSDSACRCRQGYSVYDALGPVVSESIVDGILDCYQVSLPRCQPDEIYTQQGGCVRPCEDTKCIDPPCFCEMLNNTDFCIGACPEFQTSKAERVQIDETVGMAMVCSCKCPVGSTDPRCADPDQVPIAITYEFSQDSSGTTVLTITNSAGSTPYLVPGLASTMSGSSASQFIGSSPTGFTGVLDAPLSFFEALGIVKCAFNSERKCVAAPAARRNIASAPLYGGVVVMAGPAEYHAKLEVESFRRSLSQGGAGEEMSSLRQLAVVDTQSVTGVQTPLICITAGNSVTWTITSSGGKSHYPVYMSDSLFNTNPTFDFGPFANLAQQVAKGYQVTAFSYAFEVPGVYIFYDAGDKTKQSAIGVVNPVVSCPRSFEKNPIQFLSAKSLKEFPDTKSQEDYNIITPDYQFIFGLVGALLGFFVLSVSCVYIRRTSGWGQSKGSRPAYRQLASKEDFQALATKKQRIKKGFQVGGGNLDDLDELAAGYIDLEGFNVQMLYDKLQDQTHLVAEQLTQQKHDVREFYDKVTRETVTLRTIVDKNNSAGASAEQMRRADKRRRDIDRELRRRKELGMALLAMLKRQHALVFEQGDARLEYYSKFFDGLNGLREDLERCSNSSPSEDAVRELSERLASLRADSAKQHRERPAITSATGALLLDGSGKPVSRQQMANVDGDLVEIPGLIEKDKTTGLLVPCRGTKIRLGGKHVIMMPSGMCIHPKSGNVIPMEGNVYIDTNTGVFHVGSAMGVESLSSAPLPYIINRKNENDDCYPSQDAPYAKLVPEESRGLPLNRQRDMIDPFTGLRVPVLGITSDLRTGQLVAVGGTIIDPETRLQKPLHLGDMMEDEVTKEALIIQGFAIHPQTARVVPLGGRNTAGGDSDEMPPMVMGEAFRDEFSGERKVIGGCILDPVSVSRVIPIQNDCTASLEDFEIQAEKLLFDLEEQKIQSLKQRLSPARGGTSDAEFKKVLADLTARHLFAQDEYNSIYSAINTSVLQPFTLLRESMEYASMLSDTGGQKGTLTDPVSEKELPLLIGCLMYDEHSKHDVPILFAEEDFETGKFEGLGCTVIDPISGGIVPATLGGRMRDPASSETVPITGVYRDKSTFQTFPMSTLHGDKKDAAGVGLDFDAKQLLAGLLAQMQGGGGIGGKALSDLLGGVQDSTQSHVEGLSPIKMPADNAADPNTTGWQRRKSIINMELAVNVPTLDETEEVPASLSYIDKLNNALAHYTPAEGDNDMLDAISGIKKVHKERMQDFALEIKKAEQDVMSSYEAATNEVWRRDDIDEAEKKRLLDELDRKASIMKQIMEQERRHQEAAFERQQLEAAERKMRKMTRRREKQKEIDILAESGDISTVEKAAHRLEFDMDAKLEDSLEELTVSMAKKRLEEITQEQKLLLQTLQANDVISDDLIDQLVDQYDKDVDGIENRSRNDASRAQADLEAHNDSAKAKRIARLRAPAAEKKDAKSLWQMANKRSVKNVSIGQSLLAQLRGAQTGDDPETVKAQAKSRQETEVQRLAKALDDQAQTEMKALQIDMELKRSKVIDDAKAELATMLQQDLSDEERERLLSEHESKLKFLMQTQDADQARQMRNLEARLEARRKKKLEIEQAGLHKQELELREDPLKDKEADFIAINASAAVRREVDEARMTTALQEQAEVEVQQARQKHENASQLLQAQATAERERIMSDKSLDDNERARLLKEHEKNVARMEAEAALARGKADDDLQARLEEKRRKKREFLEAKRSEEELILKSSTPGESNESVLDKIEKSRQESAVAIRQEEELAQVSSDLLAQAQAEIRMLREELKSKAQQMISGQTARLEDALLEADHSSEEREKLLKRHEEACRHMKAQTAAEEARQVASLEAKLAAKKQKKQKKLESNHVKEFEQVHQQVMRAAGSLDGLPEEVEVVFDAADAKKRLEREMKEQEEAELAAMREKMQKEKEALLEEEKRRLSQQLASDMAADMSEDDRQKLIAANDANMARLEQYMDKERVRQEEELRAMLEAKKKKKEAKLHALENRKAKEAEVQAKQEAEMAELEKQQEAERAAELEKIQSELSAEKEREAAKIALDLSKVWKKKKQQQTEEIKKKIEATSAEDEKQRLMKEAEEKIAQMEKMEQMEQAKQGQALEERLAAKRAKKAKALQKKQEEALEQKIIAQVEEAENIISAVAPEAEAEDDEAEEEAARKATEEQAKAAAQEFAKKLEDERMKFEEEMKAAVAQQEKLKEDLRRRQEEERKKLEEDMQRDALAFEEQMKRDQQAKMDELNAKKKALEADLSKASENLSAEERARMIQQHEDNLKQLESEMMAKKANMDDDLAAKLQARKAKKKKAQVKQQQEEMERLLGEQKKGEAELNKQMQGKELDALKKMWAEGEDEKAEQLLTNLHEQQLQVLRARQATQYARAMASVMDESKVAEREKEVKMEQERELSSLKQHQVKEFAELRGEKSTEALTEDSMMTLKTRLQEEKVARVRALEMSREQFEKEERAKMEDELRKMEEQIMADTMKQMDELKKRKESMSSRAEKRQQEMQDEFHAAATENQPLQTREEIDRQFMEESETLDAAIALERQKQYAILKSKLESRRNMRLSQAKQKAKQSFEDNIAKLRTGQIAIKDIDLQSLSKKDQAKARAALAASQMRNILNSKDAVSKAANKWMTKAFGRSLHQHSTIKEADSIASSHLDKLLDRQTSFTLTPRKTYIRAQHPHEASSLNDSVSSLNERLLNATSSPSADQRLILQMEEQKKENDALKERLRKLESAPPPAPAPVPATPTTPAAPPDSALPRSIAGPTKEEWSQIIRDSPLGEKLEQVEDLLRKLLVQTAEQFKGVPVPPLGAEREAGKTPLVAAPKKKK